MESNDHIIYDSVPIRTCFAFLSPSMYLTGVICFFIVSLFAGKDLQVVIITSEQDKLFTLLALYI